MLDAAWLDAPTSGGYWWALRPAMYGQTGKIEAYRRFIVLVYFANGEWKLLAIGDPEMRTPKDCADYKFSGPLQYPKVYQEVTHANSH